MPYRAGGAYSETGAAAVGASAYVITGVPSSSSASSSAIVRGLDSEIIANLTGAEVLEDTVATASTVAAVRGAAVVSLEDSIAAAGARVEVRAAAASVLEEASGTAAARALATASAIGALEDASAQGAAQAAVRGATFAELDDAVGAGAFEVAAGAISLVGAAELEGAVGAGGIRASARAAASDVLEDAIASGVVVISIPLPVANRPRRRRRRRMFPRCLCSVCRRRMARGNFALSGRDAGAHRCEVSELFR